MYIFTSFFSQTCHSISACNAVAMFENGALTMKNYGNRRNCTVSIIYPSKIQALNVDVGVTAERPTVEAEIGLSDKVVYAFCFAHIKKGHNN